MHASWNCGAKCLASTRPTSRRKASPTTEGSDPSIGLSERDQAARFRTGKPKGGAVQQLGILLIVEENAEMLVGGAGGSSSGSRVGQHANRQGKPARVEGSAPRARTGVRPLAVVHRGRVVAFQGREARRGCRACRVRGAQQ